MGARPLTILQVSTHMKHLQRCIYLLLSQKRQKENLQSHSHEPLRFFHFKDTLLVSIEKHQSYCQNYFTWDPA